MGFWDAYGWRRHGPLVQHLEESADHYVPLDPVPLGSAEGHFHPVQHFRAWRGVEGAHAAGEAKRKLALAAAIAERQEDRLSP